MLPVIGPANKYPILKFVSPKKTIFTASFAFTTTAENIKVYILDHKIKNLSKL